MKVKVILLRFTVTLNYENCSTRDEFVDWDLLPHHQRRNNHYDPIHKAGLGDPEMSTVGNAATD